MGKGRKKALVCCNKPEEPLQTKAVTGTKENKPDMNEDTACKAQPTILSIWTSRSPLSDTSSSVVLEENVSVKVNPQVETSKLDKVRSNQVSFQVSVSRLEENTEKTCSVPGSNEAAVGPAQETESHTEPETSKRTALSKTDKGTKHKVKAKRAECKASQNTKVTDYYPIRRSSRKSKAELKNEEHNHIDDLIKNGVEEGLQVKIIEGKGRGIFATRDFKKGEFVVEYHGDLIHLADAKKKEALYAQDPATGCYMYYFQYHCKTYCVDATKETSRLGRLINHSKNGNCQTKLHGIDGIPHLILVASRDIKAKEELLYDYGDRSKASISAHPWLKH